MTEEMLKTYVNSVLVEKKKAYINLAEEVVDNYREIMQHEFMFDRKQKICDILENGNITIKEVQEYFNKNFIFCGSSSVRQGSDYINPCFAFWKVDGEYQPRRL